MSTKWPLVAALAALIGVVVASPPEAVAQEDGPAWFPGSTAFDPLLAAPREVSLRGSLVFADRDAPPGAGFQGTNLEAEVSLGHRIGVLRFQRETAERPAVTLGFEVGVFTRFALEQRQRDLIEADFRVGAPLAMRHGPWEGRLTLLHVSSHLGDDFVRRFGDAVPGRQFTRDGFELVVARRLPEGVRVHVGGEWNFHANPGVERTAARAGAAWDPAPPDAGGGSGDGFRAWPFAAVALRATDATAGAAVTGTAGAALAVSGVVLRLEARGHTGPSPMGQLQGRDERFLGVGLRVEP